MSMEAGNEAETAIAVSHTNPLQITSVSNIEINGTFHSWSTDGGSTWQHNVIANGDALGFACCDAQLASDDFGNIFLTYLSSDISIKMAISTDGGATFQPLVFLTNLPFGLPVSPWKSLAKIGQSVSGDQPSISTGAGSVWISWTSFDGSIQASGAIVTHEPLPVVKADEMQLTQLFQNLIMNAVKFRGDISPSVRRRRMIVCVVSFLFTRRRLLYVVLRCTPLLVGSNWRFALK